MTALLYTRRERMGDKDNLKVIHQEWTNLANALLYPIQTFWDKNSCSSYFHINEAFILKLYENIVNKGSYS